MRKEKMMHEVIEKFYLNMLDYMGLKYQDGIIQNKDEKLGEITLSGKHLTLPYYENLKNPNNRIIIHPLNENYVNPETEIFKFLKKRLILEINLKLSSLIINYIHLASEPMLQNRINDPKLIDLIVNIGEVDHVTIENFLNIIKASKQNNDQSFILDIFLKKNASIGDNSYSAIGKVNFILYKELLKALEDPESKYKVFNTKVRKKDIIALISIHKLFFPGIDEKDAYADGTDNKVFRYLNALLKVSYLITNRINELASMIDNIETETINAKECMFNHEWINYLEKLYDLTNEIRLIPDQTDITVEKPKKLSINESKVKDIPEFNPKEVAQASVRNVAIPTPNPQSYQPQVQSQVNVQKELTPEEIIRNSLNMQNNFPQYPMNAINPYLTPQPVMPPQAATPLPSWAQRELFNQQAPNMNPTYGYAQPLQPSAYPQQPMYPQQQMYPYQQPPFMGPQVPQGGGLAVNPSFLNPIGFNG